MSRPIGCERASAQAGAAPSSAEDALVAVQTLTEKYWYPTAVRMNVSRQEMGLADEKMPPLTPLGESWVRGALLLLDPQAEIATLAAADYIAKQLLPLFDAVVPYLEAGERLENLIGAVVSDGPEAPRRVRVLRRPRALDDLRVVDELLVVAFCYGDLFTMSIPFIAMGWW